MFDPVNISFGDAALTALLGYIVVFFGLILLMIVVMIMSKIMINSTNKQKAKAAAAVAAAPAAAPIPEAPKPEAPGSAGEVKLYNTDPRDAAMIMAIVADNLGKPINELRFISIKEVKDDEV